MIEWLSPEMVVQIIRMLEFIRAGCFCMGLLGAVLLMPSLSLRGGGSPLYGIAFILIAVGGAAGCTHGINTLQVERPFIITPGSSWNTSEYQPIVSLSDGQAFGMSGHGSFFLGIGSVSVNGQTTPQYVFYKNTSDGYQIGTMPAADVFVREDADQSGARIEWLYQHTLSDKKVFTDNGETYGGAESVALIKKYIHVPPGTVRVQFNLDSNLGGA